MEDFREKGMTVIRKLRQQQRSVNHGKIVFSYGPLTKQWVADQRVERPGMIEEIESALLERYLSGEGGDRFEIPRADIIAAWDSR